MSLVKSKQRVADQGEVFTPAWMHLGKHEIFTPAKSWQPMTVGDLCAGFEQEALEPSPEEEA